MKTTPINNYYKTSEFSLGAALLVLGFSIEEISRNDERRVELIFKRTHNFDEIVSSFWKGTLNVPAMAFYQSLNALKARIRNDT